MLITYMEYTHEMFLKELIKGKMCTKTATEKNGPVRLPKITYFYFVFNQLVTMGPKSFNNIPFVYMMLETYLDF